MWVPRDSSVYDWSRYYLGRGHLVSVRGSGISKIFTFVRVSSCGDCFGPDLESREGDEVVLVSPCGLRSPVGP